MAVDPVLASAGDLLARRRWTEARIAFESFAEATDGPEEELGLALVRLAGGLEAAAEARRDEAADHWTAALAALDGLPDRLLGVDLERLRRRLPPRPEEAVARPPSLPAAPRLPRRALARFALFLALLALGLALLRWSPAGEYLERERLVALLAELRGHWWTPLLLVLGFIVCSPLGLPATPLIFAGAAVFGTVMGSVYNIVGTICGATASFLVAQLLGRDLVAHLAGSQLSRVEALLERYGFWSLVRVRLVPIPFPVVNFGAALAGVPLRTFVVTSTLGLIPAVAIYSWFGASVMRAAAGDGEGPALVSAVVAVGLALLLSLLPTWIRGWRRRRRYRRLAAARQREMARRRDTAG